jgi:hypothetical protein
MPLGRKARVRSPLEPGDSVHGDPLGLGPGGQRLTFREQDVRVLSRFERSNPIADSEKRSVLDRSSTNRIDPGVSDGDGFGILSQEDPESGPSGFTSRP